LIDKQKNLFNGKRSDVLALFDVKGKLFDFKGFPLLFELALN